MLCENESNMTKNVYNNLEKAVNVPITLYESLKGNYFAGQSEIMWVTNNSNAWAGLISPPDSGVNLYANVITISNFSDYPLIAEVWINTDFIHEGIASLKVSPSNTAIKPKPKNKVELRYMQSTDEVPSVGINVFDRIIPPNGTLVSEEGGKFIFPPCGNYTIFIKSSSPEPTQVIVAFGWWEEKIKD